MECSVLVLENEKILEMDGTAGCAAVSVLSVREPYA